MNLSVMTKVRRLGMTRAVILFSVSHDVPVFPLSSTSVH